MLHKLIHRENSVESAHQIAQYISNNEEEFPNLLTYLDHNEMHFVKLSAWALGHLPASLSKSIYRYKETLIQLLLKPRHNSVRRNVLKALNHVKWKDDDASKIWDVCCYIIENKNEPSSHHAYAMSLMYQIILEYPELFTEFKTLIEHLGDKKSAAVISRYQNILQDLKKRKVID